MAEEDVQASWKRPEMCSVPHSPQQGVTHLLSQAAASARSNFPTCCLFSGGKGCFSKRGISPATPPRLHFLKPKFDDPMNWFHMNTSAVVRVSSCSEWEIVLNNAGPQVGYDNSFYKAFH